jgi:cobalt-zinc-cadmium resistance protein CzcA
MIRAIVRWSTAHAKLVIGFYGIFVIGAAVVSRELKFDALPDITTNQVIVLTRAPGLTPEEVERRVARPIELVLGGLPGLTQHRSISRYGISSVTAIFADAVDPYRARQVVQERLNTLSGVLPEGVVPELGPLTGGLGEIFHFTLSSEARSPTELLELAQYKVAPLLRGVQGVVELNTWGGQRRTLDVLADPIRLAQRGLTLDALKAALMRATGSAAGGSVSAGAGTQTLLRATAFPRSASELAMAVVAAGAPGGRPVRVADVAEVRVDALLRIGAATANGGGETVYLMAQMLRGANALEVMAAIHGRLPAVRAVLPPDVRLDVVYDRSVLVHNTLRTVGKNLLEGGLLVVGVLLLTLGSLRAGLLVASAIPLSILGATVAMVMFGIPGNLMSLGAIDFGLVVDGAVVVIEQQFHSLRTAQDDDRGTFRARVGAIAESVAPPMFFSVLVILLVYVPILALTGVDGKMFRPMALTVVFALGTSLLASLTFIPAAATVLLRPRDIPKRDPWLVRHIDKVYRPILARAIGHPWFVVGGAAVLLAVGVVLFARIGSEFMPQLDEGDLVVQTTRPPDIDLDSAIRTGGTLERTTLDAAPEVSQVVSRIGSPAVATDIMGLEQADVFVRLRPADSWRPGLHKDQLIRNLEEAITAKDRTVELSFTQPIQMRFNELLGGAVTDVTAAVYGDDLRELRRIATEIVSGIRGENGAQDVRVLASPDVSLLQVTPRALEASQRGFTAAEILDAVEAIRTGIEVGITYDGPIRIPIRLRLATSIDAAHLGELMLPSAAGGLVPLSHVTDVEPATTPILVNHQDGERRLLVGFNVRGAELGVVVARAQARIARTVRMPAGYRLVWGGQYENLQAAARRLSVVVPVVIVLILAVLFAAFRKVRPPLIIFMNVPFACVGGIIALASRGMPLSISAAIGFIALSGIAVMNGVVLVSKIILNQESGESPPLAVANAARDRARPVLMTALVAALGFIPMALARGVGAEVQRPLATVVVGGLATSTLLTLVILPSLYPRLLAPGRFGRRQDR